MVRELTKSGRRQTRAPAKNSYKAERQGMRTEVLQEEMKKGARFTLIRWNQARMAAAVRNSGEEIRCIGDERERAFWMRRSSGERAFLGALFIGQGRSGRVAWRT